MLELELLVPATVLELEDSLELELLDLLELEEELDSLYPTEELEDVLEELEEL